MIKPSHNMIITSCKMSLAVNININQIHNNDLSWTLKIPPTSNPYDVLISQLNEQIL